MSVIPVYEEFVSAFGSDNVNDSNSNSKKEIPRPPCKNRNRTTLKCRRMCCKKPVRIEDGGGKRQQTLTLAGIGQSPRDQAASWRNKMWK